MAKIKKPRIENWRIAIVLMLLLFGATSNVSLPFEARAQTASTLSLDSIPDTVHGGSVTLRGFLLDSLNAGVPGKTITFSGSGAANFGSATTDDSGMFNVTAPAPDESIAELTVQAHFDGDDVLSSSQSEIVSYNTFSQYEVPSGSSIAISIDELAVTIQFDSVDSEGLLYASLCDAPSHSRYLEMDCLQISSTAQLTADTNAHIIMPFDQSEIPSSHAGAELGIFIVDDENNVNEITESQDLIGSTITGRTATFGTFVLGVSVHSEKSANQVRHQVLVGDANEILFRDIDNMDFPQASISLGKTRYTIGSDVVVTATDPEANLDSDLKNTIGVEISSTSDPDGISITLEETGANTSTFEGSFKIVSGESRPNVLHVQGGDVVTASFDASHARMKIVIDDVVAAGQVQISDYVVSQTNKLNLPFFALGPFANVSLVDAELGPNAKTTVTMSWANFDQNGHSSDELRIFERRIVEDVFEDWVDITKLNDDGTHAIYQNETIVGETIPGQDPLGVFVVGCCIPGPGGSSGGLITPIGGIVLDSSSEIARRSGGHGGASASVSNEMSSTTENTVQVAAGENVEVSTLADNGSINIQFSSVQSGKVNIGLSDIQDKKELFDSISNTGVGTQGIVILGETEFATLGKLITLQPSSDLQYSGSIYVTMPYNQSMLNATRYEDDIRLLHYDNESGWQDVTINLNTTSNTVTGQIESFSEFILAVVNDSTYGDLYFEEHPLDRIQLQNISVINVTDIAEPLSVMATARNLQRNNETYAFIVQISDGDDVVRNLNFQIGTLTRGQSIDLTNSWIPEEKGRFKIKIFLWDDLDNPSPLSSTVSLG